MRKSREHPAHDEWNGSAFSLVVLYGLMAGRLSDLTLRDGVSVELPNGVAVVQFPATASDGSTQGLITVEELVPGFWSTTQIASCADGEA